MKASLFAFGSLVWATPLLAQSAPDPLAPLPAAPAAAAKQPQTRETVVPVLGPAHFPAETLQSVIPRSVRISEAPSYGQSVITYDGNSPGSLSYREAASEIARRGER